MEPHGPMGEWSVDQAEKWIQKQIGDIDPSAAATLAKAQGHLDALKWSDTSLRDSGISSAKTRELLLRGRDQVVNGRAPEFSAELFLALDVPRHPTSMLTVRDGQLETVPCNGVELPVHQAELISYLSRAHLLAQRALYNHSNAMALVKMAVKVHMAVMDSSDLRNDATCGLRMVSRVWEMNFFLSLFSCRGWLRRLLHIPKPPDDAETFHGLSMAFIELLPLELGAEFVLEKMEDDTKRLTEALERAGAYKLRAASNEREPLRLSEGALSCPAHVEPGAWREGIRAEEEWLRCSKDTGPHLGIRHPDLRALWQTHLCKEEVPWKDFWAALADSKPCASGSWAAAELEKPEGRRALQARMNLCGHPDTISALEADLAFPPLNSLGASLERLLGACGRCPAGEQRGCSSAASWSAPAASAMVGLFMEGCGESGVVCLTGDSGTGKHTAALQASEELLRTGVWQRCHEVDLRSATTATEAADMLAAGLHCTPYCLASYGTRQSGRMRLSSWAEAQSSIPISSEGPETMVVGLVVTHMNRALLGDEIESDSFIDVLSSLLDQVQQSREKSISKRLRQVSLQLLVTVQQPLDLPEGRDWFVQSHHNVVTTEAATQMVRGAAARGGGGGQQGSDAAPMGGDEATEQALVGNLQNNPLALLVLGSACGHGVVPPAEALALLKRKMPASVAMGRKTQLPPGIKSGVPVKIARPDDKLGGARAGRKHLGDTKAMLVTPLARVMIALKAFTPEYLQMALVLLSYIPSGFDLQLAVRILSPISERHGTYPASLLHRLIQFNLLQFDKASGTFIMEASVQDVVQALMQHGDPTAELKSAIDKAVVCVLDTCGAAISLSSCMVSRGAPVCALYVLEHHLPMFWKIQYWSQEHVLDNISGTWLESYLQPMAEHPGVFIQHLPAGARASLCRMMAAAAGYIGNYVGKAVVLWHLGQAQMEEGQLKGAMAVLERGVEAINVQRSPENPSHAQWAATAPRLVLKLLEAQLHCGLTVCAARMADSTKSRQLVKRAVVLQQEVLEEAGELEQDSSEQQHQGGLSSTVRDRAQVGRDVYNQLSSSLLLNASIEMAMCEYINSAVLFAEATKVARSPDKDPLLHCMALGEHGSARAFGLSKDWAKAAVHLSAATDLWESAGTAGPNAVNDLLDLAELQSLQGNSEAAKAALAKATGIMQDRGDADEDLVLRLEAALLNDGGNHTEEADLPEKEVGPRGCCKPVLRRMLSSRSRSNSNSPSKNSSSPGPASPGPRAYDAVITRWQHSLQDSNPTWGWCGIQGWPLDIWCSPAQTTPLQVSPLLTRTVTTSRIWSTFCHDKDVEQLGMLHKPAKPHRAASSISRQPSRDSALGAAVAEPEVADPLSTSLERNREAAAAQEAQAAATASAPPERAAPAPGPPPTRRRRPAGRQASGSLAHARAGGGPQTLESKVARYAEEGTLGQEDAKGSSQSMASFQSTNSITILEEEEEEDI